MQWEHCNFIKLGRRKKEEEKREEKKKKKKNYMNPSYIKVDAPSFKPEQRLCAKPPSSKCTNQSDMHNNYFGTGSCVCAILVSGIMVLFQVSRTSQRL